MANSIQKQSHNGQLNTEAEPQWPTQHRSRATMANSTQKQSHNGQLNKEAEPQWPTQHRSRATMANSTQKLPCTVPSPVGSHNSHRKLQLSKHYLFTNNDAQLKSQILKQLKI
jgi:hypothetical protein